LEGPAALCAHIEVRWELDSAVRLDAYYWCDTSARFVNRYTGALCRLRQK